MTLQAFQQLNQESINMIDVYNVSHEDYREDLFAANHPSGNPTSSLTSHTDLTSPEVINQCDCESHCAILEPRDQVSTSPHKDMDSIFEDSVDENSLDEYLVDKISEMFINEHALDYSSPPLWDDYDDNLFDLETMNR
ncbi:hypothetical protein Tco_0422331 [Tanacetum coccineum]